MKIEKTTILIFVAVTFIFGLLTNANANIIANGSFEVGLNPDPPGVLVLDLGSTNVNGWTVTRDDIDYIGTYWEASHGDRSLDLDNSPLDNSTGFGGIEQTFTTTPGVNYIVTFAMAGNPYREFNDPPIKHMRVEAAGDSNDFSFDTTGKSFGAMGWKTYSWEFTAASNTSTTTLEFYSLHTSAEYSGWCGPALDNVSVVPEPATLSLLGLGALSLLRRRKK